VTGISIKKVYKETCDSWVNTIWFTDLFEYEDEHSDSMASVFDKLEELDENNRILTAVDINKYIEALLKNEEV
jgi:hypothetical protein